MCHRTTTRRAAVAATFSGPSWASITERQRLLACILAGPGTDQAKDKAARNRYHTSRPGTCRFPELPSRTSIGDRPTSGPGRRPRLSFGPVLNTAGLPPRTLLNLAICVRIVRRMARMSQPRDYLRRLARVTPRPSTPSCQ